MKAIQPTVTATYHAAEMNKLRQTIAALEIKLEDELLEGRRVERKLAIAETCLKNVDEGWPYREYEERLYEEKL